MNFNAEHIGLPAQNPTALKDWYVKVLGATVAFAKEDNSPAYFVRLGGGLMLEIYVAELALADTGNNSLAGWRHLALQVESIEEAKANLELNGVKFPDPIKPAGGGGSVLFFRDAENNLLHLVERPKDSVFHV
jgi:catechol 2,3-dioxygenase-like lactoylglutathione lyase family enzyme